MTEKIQGIKLVSKKFTRHISDHSRHLASALCYILRTGWVRRVGSAGSSRMPAWTRSNKHFLNCRYGLYLCTHKCMHVIQAGLKTKGLTWHLPPGSLFSIPTCAGVIGWNETSLQVTQWSSLSAKGIWVLGAVRLCSPLLQHHGPRKLKFSKSPSEVGWWSCAASPFKWHTTTLGL